MHIGGNTHALHNAFQMHVRAITWNVSEMYWVCVL